MHVSEMVMMVISIGEIFFYKTLGRLQDTRRKAYHSVTL